MGLSYWEQLGLQLVGEIENFFMRVDTVGLLFIFPPLLGILIAWVLKAVMTRYHLPSVVQTVLMGVAVAALLAASCLRLVTFEWYLYLFAYGWFLWLLLPFGILLAVYYKME